MARDRFSHRPMVTCRFFFRSAGACPPRSVHGEGQALALREEAAFFSPQRGSLSPRRGAIYETPSVKRCRGFLEQQNLEGFRIPRISGRLPLHSYNFLE